MLFAGLASGCALLVLQRSKKALGCPAGVWPSQHFALYREYWRIASNENWSRLPLILGLGSFSVACYFLLRSADPTGPLWLPPAAGFLAAVLPIYVAMRARPIKA